MRWIVILLLLGSFVQAEDPKSLSLEEVIGLVEASSGPHRDEILRKLRSLQESRSTARVTTGFLDSIGVDASGSEVMSGSRSVNGKRTDYTLRSLGKGRYKLEASTSDANGEKSRVKDEGTLAELRKRYEFLGDVGAMVLPLRFSRPPVEQARIGIPELGIKVKRPGADLAWHFFVPPGVGFVVTDVDPLSLGHKLGLKPHDLLLKIDGRPIEGKTQLAAIAKGRGKLEAIRRAKPVQIEFPRDE
jgi:hypothetical protein